MNVHYIDGQWREGAGSSFDSIDPVAGRACWSGRAATVEDVDAAFVAARAALEGWADRTVEQRAAYIEAFVEQLREDRETFAKTISGETGKPMWESRTEVDAMLGKGPTSIAAYHERRAPVTVDVAGGRGHTFYKPHGVVAVFGPFNLPGHLPNGHIMPALIAGNTIVFKPSERTPGVASRMVELWHRAGLPPGVLNLVQGARETGQCIVGHSQLDGLFFTGSFAAGRAINRALADTPGKIVALEMGGNNPLIVDRVGDVEAAAYHTILSAFITAGQRCTCARRLILPEGAQGDDFLDRLVAMAGEVRVGGPHDEPEPFMGPVISAQAADGVLDAQQKLLQEGGKVILPMRRLERSSAMLTPGIVDVTDMSQRVDEEVFGPLLQVIRVRDFEAALDEANNTAFGLAAGLLSDDAARFDRFYKRIRAGVLSWNRQTTGASGKLPFGGVGQSGNHRPSGYFAADYSAYPVALLEREHLVMPEKTLPGVMR